MIGEQYFLNNLFTSLRSYSINYCVLRNYSNLPISTGNSDLDILINKKDVSEFLDIISKISCQQGGHIISIIQSEVCPRICVLGKNGLGWGIMVDLHYDEVSYRGYTILSNSIIWQNTFLYKGQISVLNSKADSLIGLFKELLNNERCAPKYFNNFKELALESEFIQNVFTDINKPHLVEFFLKYKQEIYSETTIAGIVSKLNTEFPKKKFPFLNYLNKLSRIFKQPGFTLAFMGSDGSGKSTIIESITPPLSDAFHKAVYYEHMRPNKIPSIARLSGKKENFNGPVTNPHGSSTSGFLGSLLRWSYYMLDYTFGFYLKVWPKKAIRSCVWIFDRYYYDYLIDPKRSRIKLPKWILKFGQYIIPEPDIILCLGADAKLIHKRKPELPLEEVERQVAVLKAFCASHKRAVWIDTGESIESSSNAALEAIINKMAARFKTVNI